jgi:hypothetical protein
MIGTMMGFGDNLNQIGRTFEVQALYQQALLQSDLEIRQSERRLNAQRRQKELTVQPGQETLPQAGVDMELSHRNSDTNPKYGSGRHLDIHA